MTYTVREGENIFDDVIKKKEKHIWHTIKEDENIRDADKIKAKISDTLSKRSKIFGTLKKDGNI